MKRCWFGGGLLIFLLVAGVLLSSFIDKFHRQLGESMAWAAVLAEEDREEALTIAEQSRRRWEDRRWLTAVLNDHAPMEAIEELFALLTPEVEDSDFRDTCLRLTSQLNALGEAQKLTLENLF